MLGSEISKILKSDFQCKPFFRGVFASNTLPNVLPRGQNHALVINLDSNKKPGSHWVGLFISSSGHGVYFDSLGLNVFITNIKLLCWYFCH